MFSVLCNPPRRWLYSAKWRVLEEMAGSWKSHPQASSSPILGANHWTLPGRAQLALLPLLTHITPSQQNRHAGEETKAQNGETQSTFSFSGHSSIIQNGDCNHRWFGGCQVSMPHLLSSILQWYLEIFLLCFLPRTQLGEGSEAPTGAIRGADRKRLAGPRNSWVCSCRVPSGPYSHLLMAPHIFHVLQTCTSYPLTCTQPEVNSAICHPGHWMKMPFTMILILKSGFQHSHGSMKFW